MLQIIVIGVIAGLISWYFTRRRRALNSIAHIAGPPSTSFIMGNFSEYFLGEVGEHEFAWQEQYGAVYRIRGLFGARGEDRLIIADPKTLQYCYQNNDTNWPKPGTRREWERMILGRGVAWAQGEDHKRHRKILSPAFGNVDSRGMMPIFRKMADRMCQHWQDAITHGADGSSTLIDVADWISRAALDSLGEAAFHYEFRCLENQDNKLARSFSSLLVHTFAHSTKRRIFAQRVISFIPVSFLPIMEKLPLDVMRRLREAAEEGDKVARELIKDKMEAMQSGVPQLRRDIMDILVHANTSADPSSRLSEEELYAQLRTIMVAGHETTGSQLCWILYELARRPDIQDKCHAEIAAMMKVVNARGDQEYDVTDLDSLRYTLAVLKEGLRMHPVIYVSFLAPQMDDVLPLSKPIRTKDGRMLSEIPVRAGQYVHLSLAGYNRHALLMRSPHLDIWGDDVHDFRPERWLAGELPAKAVKFGLYANLGNFASGDVSCLGWRFAVIEMQTTLVEILRNFKLSFPETGVKIFRSTGGLMTPVLAGDPQKKQLPLMVTSLS
ncbi:cytochrome P450 [Obba rivulosa]|uniref:Cytochrome P450 n=1 Tax=Obba rivulosa TaxID=1052685 RepID=A0A8E2AYB3_9APHY|nr:cytochrome P450 [Obba rivulosa]